MDSFDQMNRTDQDVTGLFFVGDSVLKTLVWNSFAGKYVQAMPFVGCLLCSEQDVEPVTVCTVTTVCVISLCFGLHQMYSSDCTKYQVLVVASLCLSFMVPCGVYHCMHLCMCLQEPHCVRSSVLLCAHEVKCVNSVHTSKPFPFSSAHPQIVMSSSLTGMYVTLTRAHPTMPCIRLVLL